MIVPSRINYWALFKSIYPMLIFFILLSCAVGALITFAGLTQLTIDGQYITILAAAVSIFLGFRINSGYDRWWEARKIWGEITNDSRAFIATALALSDDNIEIKRVIEIHLAYINALRLSLRQQSETQDIERWLTPNLWQQINLSHNLATQINRIQAQYLKDLISGNTFDTELKHLKLLEFNDRFYASQGKCERIKNTVFPWGYAKYTKIFVWLMACLLPFHLVTELNLQSVVLCSLISFVFVTVEKVGSNLDNPFQNSFNDTPMSAICRNIEIDLLQMLGIKPVPAPVSAKNGVLM